MEETNPALELEVRKTIYQTILKSPGLHFRELQRRTDLVIGSLQYHLNYLKKRGLIIEEKDRGYSRFYVGGKLDEREKELLSFLRQGTVRRIIFFLVEHPNSNHKRITEKMRLSPSTVSWHLKRLTEAEILKNIRRGRESYFKVSNPDLIIKVLISYRESFIDRLVDKFIESWT